MHSFFDVARIVAVCLSIIAGAADPALSATKDSERVFQKIDELRRIPVWTRANVEKSLGIRTWREAVWYWTAEKSAGWNAVHISIDRKGNVCSVELVFRDDVDIRAPEIETKYGRRTSRTTRGLGHRKASAAYLYGKGPWMRFEVSESFSPPRALLVELAQP